MKYVMVIADGMADYPVKDLGGLTPLQVANHPNMDKIISQGVCGTLNTVPNGLDINTDVAVFSIMGYDPKKYYDGRGPLEAASQGILLDKESIAFRCNLISEKDGFLYDYSAGHIETVDAKKLITCLNRELGVLGKITFYPGVDYRHLLVFRGTDYSKEVKCFPPHDVVGKPIKELMVSPLNKSGGKMAPLLNKLILKSRDILSNHPVNIERISKKQNPANMIWPWSPGKAPKYPNLQEKYGLNGAVISAVDVIKGIGIYAGMSIIEVPGATGYIDTNYEGKAKYALKSLEDHDFVLIHVEAPDEAGHMGDHNLKIKTIEDLDARLLGLILNEIKDDFTIALLCDHLTPVTLRTHTSDPVPFAIYSNLNKKNNAISHFNEICIKRSSLHIKKGSNFFQFFLRYGTG
jgi:2,3-bisphosphoglycerate-independent phosphoglycerate mutase